MKNLIIIFSLFIYYCSSPISAQTTEIKSTGTAKSTEVKQKTDKEELVLMKSFKGETIETTKKITIGTGFSILVLELHGHVKSGKINITLYKPNNEKFKYIEIDATSDVTFEKKISLSEYPGCIGDWQVKIQTENAEGSYRLVIETRN